MKSERFTTELNYICNEDIKNFTKVALDSLPDYFFEVAASSTGKYHPSYALGSGGLVRHTQAATRFANHLLQLEHNQNKFTERERDCIISAIILHDGWKHGNKGSSFTTHEHPQVCADWIKSNELFDDFLPEEDRNIISDAVSSHMGQWNSTKRSKVILNKPETDIQKFVHTCDYLASRKDIEVLFDGVRESTTKEKIDINTYKLTFGKHKGLLIKDVFKDHKDYIEWMSKNMELKEPLKTFVTELLK